MMNIQSDCPVKCHGGGPVRQVDVEVLVKERIMAADYTVTAIFHY
jgi:hypothetical protein